LDSIAARHTATARQQRRRDTRRAESREAVARPTRLAAPPAVRTPPVREVSGGTARETAAVMEVVVRQAGGAVGGRRTGARQATNVALQTTAVQRRVLPANSTDSTP